MNGEMSEISEVSKVLGGTLDGHVVLAGQKGTGLALCLPAGFDAVAAYQLLVACRAID